jgi:ribosomal protein S18 acetylase RimI-like enzyme
MDTLTMAAVACRPVLPADEPFLRRVYASTRERELAAVEWSDEQKAAFVDMQFDAQARYYEDVYTGASYQVIEVDGVPAGRLYLWVGASEIRIVDITLLPEHRGRGVGSGLLRGLVEQGRASGNPVSIHVEFQNPARGLYERLGFVEAGQRGIYTLMEWRPS